MKLIELCYIEEAKEDFIAKQMGDKIMDAYKKDTHKNNNFGEYSEPLEIVNHIAQASRKHLQALVNWYVKGQFMLEDIPQIIRWVNKFEEVKNKLDNKDLTRYNSLSDFVDKIEEFDENETVSNKELARNIKSKEAEKIYQDEQITVVVPKTEKAACYYGKGTRWCTASTDDGGSAFQSYNKNGKLYIVLTKDGRKFQFHFESLQFMDEKDEPINFKNILEKYPSLKNAFNDIAEKHNFFPLINDPSKKDKIEMIKKSPNIMRYMDQLNELNEDIIIKAILESKHPTMIIKFIPYEYFTKNIIVLAYKKYGGKILNYVELSDIKDATHEDMLKTLHKIWKDKWEGKE